MQKQSKGTFISVIIIIIVALGLYFYYNSTPKNDPTSSIETTNNPESEDARVVGARVLTLLKQINSLEINASLFDNIVYKSLEDYTVAIPEQPVGRANPFIPVR